MKGQRPISTSLGSVAAKRQRLERVIEIYLRACFRQKTVARVSELAALLGASRTYLSEIVPQVLGKPLGAALRERQLAHAAKLLGETTIPAKEIASMAAFGTERTFFRAFKRLYGETPISYRSKTDQMSVDATSRRR